MSKHDIIGQVLAIHPEDDPNDFPPARITGIGQQSDRQISLDLVEPDGTMATVSLKSQDGENFEGPYRKKDQEPDGVVRVEKIPTGKDRPFILDGTWEKASGEEWWWIGRIEPDEEPPEPAD